MSALEGVGINSFHQKAPLALQLCSSNTGALPPFKENKLSKRINASRAAAAAAAWFSCNHHHHPHRSNLHQPLQYSAHHQYQQRQLQ